MVTGFLVIAVLSIVFPIIIYVGWKMIPTRPINKDFTPSIKISVVIPLRNEEENIENLLWDLDRQHFPKEHFQVILIDDHSTDDTALIAQKVAQKQKLDLIIQINAGKGKKEALQTGILLASGQLILTTDGDCRLGQNWLASIVSYFEESDAIMISGPVRFFNCKSIWTSTMMMEFAALQGVGAATLYMGLPTMCNGANLAYLKSAFLEVGGFEGNKHIPSGDDEFLMHKFSLKYPGRIHYLISREAIVDTGSSSGIDWIYQRIRWASKWKGYKIQSPRLIAVAVLLFNINMIFGAILWLKGMLDFQLFILAIGGKILVDYFLVHTINNFLERRSNPLIFIILDLVYPLYILSFGILGTLGIYSWKGRNSKIQE